MRKLHPKNLCVLIVLLDRASTRTAGAFFSDDLQPIRRLQPQRCRQLAFVAKASKIRQKQRHQLFVGDRVRSPERLRYSALSTSHFVSNEQIQDAQQDDQDAGRNKDPAPQLDAVEQIRSMRVRDIKNELTDLGVSTKDIFEKEQLVQALVGARRQQPNRGSSSSASDGTSSSTSKGTRTSNNNFDTNKVLETPLILTSLDGSIATINNPGDDASGTGGYTIIPDGQQFATIQVQLTSLPGRPILSLLLDTACSGIVLRPQTVDRWNLPKLQTPVTMTGAAGMAGATGLTELRDIALVNRIVDGTDERQSRRRFGPLPAAVQDIGALPKTLDGIIGMSFLSQFPALEIDFQSQVVRFYLDTDTPVSDMEDRKCLTRGDMTLLPLGIYTTPVLLGTRGPVQMIVDTGAASTLLNWNGVKDLGLSKTSTNVIAPISSLTGAVGSENIAIQLTHRLHVSSRLSLQSSIGGVDKKEDDSILPGMSLAADEKKRLAIDIGQIPILDNLQNYGVGGILGIDAMMRCSCVKFYFKSGNNQTTSQNSLYMELRQ